MNQKTYTIQFRRKRNGKTNYKKRLKLLLSSTPRLVIRKSLDNTTAQIIEYYPEGDKVLVSSSSKELEKYGWGFGKGNVSAAYLTGLLLGKKAQKKKIDNAIFDLGLNSSTKGNRIYAALKGAIDANLDVPHSDTIFPSEDRIKGKHVAEFAKKNKKSGFEKISENFEMVKKKIMEKNES